MVWDFRRRSAVRRDSLSDDPAYTDPVKAESLFESISLEPSPAIEAYKDGIDRTLIRENLRLTPAARVEKMIAALRFAEAVWESRLQAQK
jgi:hypothetical protein